MELPTKKQQDAFIKKVVIPAQKKWEKFDRSADFWGYGGAWIGWLMLVPLLWYLGYKLDLIPIPFPLF